MIQEYLFTTNEYRSEIKHFVVPEKIQKEIRIVENSACWILSLSIDSESEEAAKLLDPLNTRIYEKYKPTVLSNIATGKIIDAKEENESITPANFNSTLSSALSSMQNRVDTSGLAVSPEVLNRMVSVQPVISPEMIKSMSKAGRHSLSRIDMRSLPGNNDSVDKEESDTNE